MQFTDLNLIEPILKSLAEEWYTSPTPIQEQSIPIILEWTDLLGCAQTGTGKTAAFALPIIQLLSATPRTEKKRKIRSLILTPTRELAVQIQESFRAYGRYTSLRSTVIFGGVGQFAQVNTLDAGIDILIATPGRLMDLIGQKHITLADIEIFVLDEADRMLDMGFIHDVKKLITMLPKKRQSLFFSATMPPEIVKLAETILQKPSKVTVTPVSSTVEVIKQEIYYVDRLNKNHLLKHLLEDQNIKTVLVFTRTKHGADKVVRMLTEHGIIAEAIHGNKWQNARQRALANFKAQTTRVLVATDIAARGIDIDELEYVINYEIPNIAETYVHRIGRTGRAGAKWTAISFCDGEEREYLRDIESLIAKKVPVVNNHPFPLQDEHPVKTSKPQNTQSNPRGNPQEKWFRQKEERTARPQSETPRNNTQKKEWVPFPKSERSPKSFENREKASFWHPRPERSENKGAPKWSVPEKKYAYWEKDTQKKSPTGKPWEQKKNSFYSGKKEWKDTDSEKDAKPQRINKRAERSWSKNKALAATQSEQQKKSERIDWDKPERTRSPRAKKVNPKPFVPQPPKRLSENSK